jgi:hypothetical protein
MGCCVLFSVKEEEEEKEMREGEMGSFVKL